MTTARGDDESSLTEVSENFELNALHALRNIQSALATTLGHNTEPVEADIAILLDAAERDVLDLRTSKVSFGWILPGILDVYGAVSSWPVGRPGLIVVPEAAQVGSTRRLDLTTSSDAKSNIDAQLDAEIVAAPFSMADAPDIAWLPRTRRRARFGNSLCGGRRPLLRKACAG